MSCPYSKEPLSAEALEGADVDALIKVPTEEELLILLQQMGALE